jgi:hypothetical protein
MAVPTFNSAGAAGLTASGTSVAPFLPVRSNGDKLLCMTVSKNNATHSYAAGWNIVGQWHSGASHTMSIAECTVNGSEVAPAPSWTGAAAARSIVFSLTGADSEIVGTSLALNYNTGTTSPHSATAITTTRADSLALVFDGCSANTALSTPSGWSMNSRTGDGTSNIATGFGTKSVATSGASSGSISVNGGAAAWVMVILELRSPGSAGILSTQLERGVRGLSRGLNRGAF